MGKKLQNYQLSKTDGRSVDEKIANHQCRNLIAITNMGSLNPLLPAVDPCGFYFDFKYLGEKSNA